jgi:hypothetical protein
MDGMVTFRNFHAWPKIFGNSTKGLKAAVSQAFSPHFILSINKVAA